jgi:hypothetical protein
MTSAEGPLRSLLFTSNDVVLLLPTRLYPAVCLPFLLLSVGYDAPVSTPGLRRGCALDTGGKGQKVRQYGRLHYIPVSEEFTLCVEEEVRVGDWIGCMNVVTFFLKHAGTTRGTARVQLQASYRVHQDVIGTGK